MKILIAPDKFKNSFSASEISDFIYSALKKKFSDTELIKFPAADGGEGSAEILAPFFDATPVSMMIHNPVFKLIKSTYYFSKKNKTAIIETASASGLHLLNKEEQNPMHTNTCGTGELIVDAIKKGAETIFLTLGGSATNDAGCGAAEAIGYKFYDKNNKQIKTIIGKKLIEIAKIDKSSVKIDFKKIKIIALHDVKNPLYGKSGAAYVYAGQKGANLSEIKLLDNGLKHFAEIIQEQFDVNLKNCEGCGAAGGFGAGSKFFFNADLKPGAKTVLQLSGFFELIKNVDFIITGEGKFDNQSFNGKLSGTIINEANKRHIPVIVICGINEVSSSITNKYKNLLVLPLFKTFPGELKAKRKTAKKIKNILLRSNFNFFM